jgi:iron complex outermembrane receptor protein
MERLTTDIARADIRSMKRRSLCAGPLRMAVAIGLLVFAAFAYAQSQVDQDLMSMNLEDLSRVKVFSASRHFEDARRAPSSVSIITASDIRRNGWRTLGEALSSLRSFYSSYDRTNLYLGVRGFMRPGDYNSRVLVLVDGHRMNDNVYSGAAIGTGFSIDLDLIDHIEVVRGPGSSLFGTNAMYAVINVITRSTGSETAIETADDTGSYLSRTSRVTVATGQGKSSALFSASYHKNPGQSSLFFPQFASPLTNNGYAENMDGNRFDSVFADLRSGGFRLQGAFSDNMKRFPTATSGTVFNNPADWVEGTRAFVDASFHKTAWSGTDIDLRLFYDNFEDVGSGAFKYPPMPGTIVGQIKTRSDSAGAEANVTREFGLFRITAGADYQYNLQILLRNVIVGEGDISHTDDTPWSAAVYGDAEVNLGPSLVVHAGGRFDHYSTFGGAANPRFAVIYTPGAHTAVKYILGKAFQAPSSAAQFYSDPINFLPPPVKLLPERILSNELILEQNLRPWISVTADGFYNELHNLLTEVPAKIPGYVWVVNDGQVDAKGLEFEVAAERASGLGARASYTVTATSDTGVYTRPVNAPVTQAKLNATSPLSRHAFAALDVMYVGPMTDYRGTRVPSYVLPNLTVNTNSLWGGWVFSSSVYNATNRRWFSPMGQLDPEDQIQQDGVTWRFKVTYRIPISGERGSR